MALSDNLSDTFVFNLDREELITKALRMLGVISGAQSSTDVPNDLASASNSLNLMLNAWQADGLQLWQTETVTITTPTANADYEFGDDAGTYTDYRPIDVLEVYRVDETSNVWVELTRLSRVDFNQLSDHDSTGTPVNYYYNNDMDKGTLSVWPIADASFIANSSIVVVLTKAFDDVTSTGDVIAFPQEWQLAVVYGLAVIMAPEYGIPISKQQLLIQQAEAEKQRVMDWDTEHVSVFYQPEANFHGC